MGFSLMMKMKQCCCGGLKPALCPSAVMAGFGGLKPALRPSAVMVGFGGLKPALRPLRGVMAGFRA